MKGHHLNVVKHVKDLRHPIEIEIDGKSMTFLTIGYCARALGRTTACLRYWEAIGLFPAAPYRLNQGQRRLYPADFIESVSRIQAQGYLGRRMNRSNWRRFQGEIWDALDLALAPLRPDPDVVTDSHSDEESREVARANAAS